MNRVMTLIGIASDEGISKQYFAGLVQLQGIFYNGVYLSFFKVGACEQNTFWDGVRMQECAQIEQFGGRWTLLFNFVKRNQPGCSNRLLIVSIKLLALATPCQE